MTKTKASLQAFAKAKAAARQQVCKVCALPPAIRKEVDAGAQSGVSLADTASWLKLTYNIVIGESTIRRHRRKGNVACRASLLNR